MKLGSADNITIIAEVGSVHDGSFGNLMIPQSQNIAQVNDLMKTGLITGITSQEKS
jgi:hypothetical protein